MPDYYPLIKSAVASLETNTAETRRALYDRARAAQLDQLRKRPFIKKDFDRARLMFEDAISRVEEEFSASDSVSQTQFTMQAGEKPTAKYFQRAKKITAPILFAMLGLGIAINWIMGGLGYGPERHIYPYEHLVNAASAAEVWCFSYQDWVITTVSGPCKGFKQPASIAKGQSFQANGTSYVINVIIATQIDRDNIELGVHKDDWYCAAAERLEDLDTQGKSWRRTWLFSPRCFPL